MGTWRVDGTRRGHEDRESTWGQGEYIGTARAHGDMERRWDKEST